MGFLGASLEMILTEHPVVVLIKDPFAMLSSRCKPHLVLMQISGPAQVVALANFVRNRCTASDGYGLSEGNWVHDVQSVF